MLEFLTFVFVYVLWFHKHAAEVKNLGVSKQCAAQLYLNNDGVISKVTKNINKMYNYMFLYTVSQLHVLYDYLIYFCPFI